ncbi:hypothetical protein Hena1_02140 [Erwinia phage Hena1]|uniref:Uncharacterized protein n=1 Tax=Erwinia phage Hena1 TaxID=2678601 RepID=A0A6B9J8F8_9CAUD|nr:methyltransferase [Erwinia phage Hena1]QGZ16364.1 hypothetical protein Hena1_02140 [Erwinia phage Hena1]
MIKKYTLTQSYSTDPSAKAGIVVYRAAKHDYGLARDDTIATGIPHVSVTFNADGDYPFFTVPETILQAADAELVGGKKFNGVIVKCRPYIEEFPRCIYGYRPGVLTYVRTSTVQSLLLENGKLYAITLNSAYELADVDLAAFLKCPEWINDLDNLIKQVVVKPAQEVKVD